MAEGAKSVSQLGAEVEGLVWKYPEQHPDAIVPDGTEGGLAVDPETGDMYGVKHSQYRLPDIQSTPGVHAVDVFPLEGLGHERSETPHTGIEVELLSVDASGVPYSLRAANGDPVSKSLQDLIGEHPELLRQTAEIDDGPHANPVAAANGVAQKFAMLQKAFPAGALIDPISAWMGERPTAEAITDNPYVHVMVDILGKHVLDFVGHGVHEHYDVGSENIHIVSRYLQIVAPLLNAGLQAAPYMHNQLNPRISEIFEGHSEVEAFAEIEKNSATTGWHSIRYPTRTLASSRGGVATMVHETQDDLLRFADTNLRTGFVNNVSRAYGPHMDVRPRYDLPPGRVELCVKDNPIGRLETTQAYMELTWAAVRAFEDAAEAGTSALEKLHADYDDIFGAEGNPSEMKTLFERTHRNSIRIAKDGPTTDIEDGHGCYVPVSHQIGQLLKFVRNAGYPVAQEAENAIRASLMSDEVSPHATIQDYYRTGLGTPADYHHARANQLKEAGLNDGQIIRELARERTAAFSSYLALRTA